MITKNLIALICLTLITSTAVFGNHDRTENKTLYLQIEKNECTDSELMVHIDETVNIIRNRLINLGYDDALVYTLDNTIICIKIPGIPDAERIQEIIGIPIKLEFIDQNDNVIIEGKDIREVAPFYDETKDRYGVAFTLSDEAAKVFEEATARLIGQPIFIMLNGEEISAPYVSEKIAGGQISISLQDELSRQESYEMAEELTVLLMSGALPVSLRVINN